MNNNFIHIQNERYEQYIKTSEIVSVEYRLDFPEVSDACHYVRVKFSKEIWSEHYYNDEKKAIDAFKIIARKIGALDEPTN